MPVMGEDAPVVRDDALALPLGDAAVVGDRDAASPKLDRQIRDLENSALALDLLVGRAVRVLALGVLRDQPSELAEL